MKNKSIKTPFIHKRYLQWIFTDSCNYRCGYCLAHSKDPFPLSPLKLIDGLEKKLKGKWEVVLLGGEPFLHPDFMASVKRLVKMGHRLSVYTNFSAPEKKIIEFLKITEGKLSGFFASLHLENVKTEDFLKKIEKIEKAWPGFKRRLFVCSVGLPENLERLKKIKKAFCQAKAQMTITVYQNADLSFFKYTRKQKKDLENIIMENNPSEFSAFAVAYSGHGLEINSVNFQGEKCPAGQKSLFLLPPGDAYRCLAAYRTKKESLGNILKNDFRLQKTAQKCLFKQCFCPAIYDQYFWWQKTNENSV